MNKKRSNHDQTTKMRTADRNKTNVIKEAMNNMTHESNTDEHKKETRAMSAKKKNIRIWITRIRRATERVR